MQIVALIFLLGMFMNRYRGGLFSAQLIWFISKVPTAILKKVFQFLLRGDTVNAVVFGCVVAHFTDINTGVFSGLGMFLGELPAWGDYVGALGGWRTDTPDKPLHDWGPIDGIIEDYKTDPKLWGFLGLTLRGLIWGSQIALSLNSFWPLLAGALMSVIYWVCLKLFGEKGWPVAEWSFGGPFWVISLISII